MDAGCLHRSCHRVLINWLNAAFHHAENVLEVKAIVESFEVSGRVGRYFLLLKTKIFTKMAKKVVSGKVMAINTKRLTMVLYIIIGDSKCLEGSICFAEKKSGLAKK